MKRLLVVLAVGLALLAAACGGSQDDGWSASDLQDDIEATIIDRGGEAPIVRCETVSDHLWKCKISYIEDGFVTKWLYDIETSSGDEYLYWKTVDFVQTD